MFCVSCGRGGFGDLEGVTTRTTPDGREVLCDDCDRTHDLRRDESGERPIIRCVQCDTRGLVGRVNPYGACPGND
jgi:hypothetical protein